MSKQAEPRYACGECGKPIRTGCYCRECADREAQADKVAELTKDTRSLSVHTLICPACNTCHDLPLCPTSDGESR